MSHPEFDFSRSSFFHCFLIAVSCILLFTSQPATAVFNVNTFDTNYHIMYLSPTTSYFGDVHMDHGNKSASINNLTPSGLDFTESPTPAGNNVKSSSAWAEVMSNWKLSDDGSFESGKNVSLPSGSNVDTSVVGVVSDSQQTNVFEAVLENPGYSSSFKKGQLLIGARYGNNISSKINNESRYIGASLNAICPSGGTLCSSNVGTPDKYFPFVQIALGSLNIDNTTQGDMFVTRNVPQFVATQTGGSAGIQRKSFTDQSLNLKDTGTFTFGGTPSDPVYKGAITPDTELVFARFNMPNFMRPMVAVRLGQKYSLEDFFGFYTVNKISVDKNPSSGDSSVVTNQSYFKAGFNQDNQGKWAAYSSVNAKNAEFNGNFTLEKDNLSTGNTSDTYFELKEATSGDTFRLYLSPSSKYFVMVPGNLEKNQVFFGFRIPSASVETVASNSSDTLTSGSTVSGTIANMTDKATTLSMGELGQSHPRNKKFTNYQSTGLANDTSIADTTLGSAVDITPDTSIQSDSFTTCLNLNNNPDTANFSDSQFVPLIYETDKGWRKVTDAGGTITSRNGARVCFKPPHFSNMALTASSTSTGNGSSSSSSSGCLIESSGASDDMVTTLRDARDHLLRTSVGRTLTEFYYDFTF